MDPGAETVSELAVRIAITRAQRPPLSWETAGRNRGPEPDRYARQVGLDPERGAYAWCTSGLYDAFLEAARQRGVPCPFPRTAKAVRAWQLLYERCLESAPARGHVYVLDHGKPGQLLAEWQSDRWTDGGHIGIVCAVDAQGEVEDEVSANTNAAGSREGNCWWMKHGTPEVSHGGILLGYLNLERLVDYG